MDWDNSFDCDESDKFGFFFHLTFTDKFDVYRGIGASLIAHTFMLGPTTYPLQIVYSL